MIRRISTKLLLAVLAAVVVPFLGFALFVNDTMADRQREVVLYSLKGLAGDLASRVDRHVEGHRRDVAIWAQSPTCDWAIDEYGRAAGERAAVEGEYPFRPLQREQFDAYVQAKDSLDLLLLLERKGRVVASNVRDSNDQEILGDAIIKLYARDFSGEPWFQTALRGELALVDQHSSDLLPPRNPAPGKHPENYHIGFAAPVHSKADPGAVIGVLYSLVNWRHIQDEIRQPVLKDYFQGLVGPEEFPSAYGWIWASDADTIIAHNDPNLYGHKVSGPEIDLPSMVEDARAGTWGLYREYTFRGKTKNAAFKHTAGPEEGGFGWVVGVGIDNDDIFMGVRELQGLLLRATLVVLLLAVLLTLVISRRTTRPIRDLQRHTQRVAAGDLDARIAVDSHDELGELAEHFNRMTAEVKEQREQLIRAEKDAAWREMARQVAHDIKNPLTPVKLSVDLVKRAKREQSPEFDRIFDSTMETIGRQVEHLREIASDFNALTGTHKPNPEVVEVRALLEEVLELSAAWAGEQHIEVSCTGPGGRVMADPALLRRVLINLVSNAFEAMPDGGRLACDVRELGAELHLEIRDTGAGIPEEVRAHLFEPYFTTRSTGTGLGLAIARRVIEELGGRISLDPAEPGPGTLAHVVLPLHRNAA